MTCQRRTFGILLQIACSAVIVSWSFQHDSVKVRLVSKMPPRAFHHKNRHGCRNCKTRRKRCDRQQPQCNECNKQSLECIYDGPFIIHARSSHAASLVPRTHSLTSAASTIDPFLQALLGAGIPYIGVSDIEMMRLLQLDHSSTFNTLPALRAIRNLNLLQIAPACPYLLHGLLAASAWYLNTQSEGLVADQSKLQWLQAKTIEHQQLALESYTLKLLVIDDTTCQSIFGFSVMLAGLEFALINRFCPDPRSGCEQCLDDLIRVFGLLQGAVTVANTSSIWIPQCRNEPLLLPIRSSLDYGDWTDSQEVVDALDTLEVSLRNAAITDIFAVEFAPIHASIISELRKVFLCLQKPEPFNFLGAVGWSAFLDPRYVLLIQERNPIALLVTAYYAAALHELEHIWWLRGVGSRIVKSIATLMHVRDTATHQWWWTLMHWPMSRIERTALSPRSESVQRPMASSTSTIPRGGAIFEQALVGTHTVERIGGLCSVHT